MTDWTPQKGDVVRVLPDADFCRQRQSVESECGCSAWVDGRGHPYAATVTGTVWDVWDNDGGGHPYQVVFRGRVLVTDDRRICACPVPAGVALVQLWERYSADELAPVVAPLEGG